MRTYIRLLLVVFSLLLTVRSQNCTAQEANAVIAAGQKVVVKLFGAGVGTLDSYGSAVLISQQGHMVTVWNHLVNTGYLTAVVSDGRRFTAKVVGTSAEHDLAVLKLDCGDEEVFPFVDGRDAATVEPGVSALAFSNMFHVATGSEPVSVVHGVIACIAPLNAGFGRWQFPLRTPVYMLDAVTNNSGAAGGLLTNIDGQPIGLIGREIRHRETGMWVNYAVPWKTLQPVITLLMDGRSVVPSPGDNDKQKMVSDRRLTADFGFTLLPGIIEKTPAYVDRVIPGSPAALAGLKRGDLVLMVNDDVVQSTDDLRTALSRFRKGQNVSITVSRDDQLESAALRVP
jgi:serine protease Do